MTTATSWPFTFPEPHLSSAGTSAPSHSLAWPGQRLGPKPKTRSTPNSAARENGEKLPKKSLTLRLSGVEFELWRSYCGNEEPLITPLAGERYPNFSRFLMTACSRSSVQYGWALLASGNATPQRGSGRPSPAAQHTTPLSTSE